MKRQRKVNFVQDKRVQSVLVIKCGHVAHLGKSVAGL